MKAKKWMLFSARENLAHQDKRLLNELMELNQPLYQGYLLKEQLRAILRHPWRYLGVMRARLHGWIVDCRHARQRTGRTRTRAVHRIANHLDAVLVRHQHHVPLGLAEATNSQIVALRF